MERPEYPGEQSVAPSCVFFGLGFEEFNFPALTAVFPPPQFVCFAAFSGEGGWRGQGIGADEVTARNKKPRRIYVRRRSRFVMLRPKQ